MKTARATLYIDVFVDCPKCGNTVDLMDDYNDEGQVISQACPDSGHWTVEHEKFELPGVKCPECQTTFNVEGLNW